MFEVIKKIVRCFRVRFLSLIEIMVVISLIAIISASIAYNVRGALEKGRYFRSVEGAKQVENVLYMHMAETGDSIAAVVAKWKQIVSVSPLIRDHFSAIKDGWGFEYKVKKVKSSSGDSIEVGSAGMLQYKKDHPDFVLSNKKG